MMDAPKIIVTGDGSHSLLNEGLNETYHSIHGALQESTHVFINNGLSFRRQLDHTTAFRILEVGFGTGLNAWLTAAYAAAEGINIHYTSLEAFPISHDVWTLLNYAKTVEEKAMFDSLHDAPWNNETAISKNFTLLKLHTSLQDATLAPAAFDVVFFDAFAPSKQPELWTYEMLEKIAKTMRGNSVFVTYCAKGQLKRDLRMLGLATDTLPGPPGKKEMVRATRLPA